MKGYFSFVLHSHIPYVLAHGRWPHGTDWLSEACAETYIPILNILNQLVREGIEPRITIGLTPVLCEQLASTDFKDEFNSYLKQKIEAAKEDIKEFTKYGEKQYLSMAQNWLTFYQTISHDFNHRYNQNLVSAFKQLQDSGYIEIITCAATHGYLPLLKEETSIQGQILDRGRSLSQAFWQRTKRYLVTRMCLSSALYLAAAGLPGFAL